MRLEEEIDVRPQSGSDLIEALRTQRCSKGLVQPQQGHGRIRTARSKTRSQWQPLLEMDGDSSPETGRLRPANRRTHHQVGSIHRKIRMGTGEANPLTPRLEGQLVVEGNREKERLKIVESVLAPSQDVQDEVDLAVRPAGEGHKKTRQPRVGAQCGP